MAFLLCIYAWISNWRLFFSQKHPPFLWNLVEFGGVSDFGVTAFEKCFDTYPPRTKCACGRKFFQAVSPDASNTLLSGQRYKTFTVQTYITYTLFLLLICTYAWFSLYTCYTMQACHLFCLTVEIYIVLKANFRATINSRVATVELISRLIPLA